MTLRWNFSFFFWSSYVCNIYVLVANDNPPPPPSLLKPQGSCMSLFFFLVSLDIQWLFCLWWEFWVCSVLTTIYAIRTQSLPAMTMSTEQKPANQLCHSLSLWRKIISIMEERGKCYYKYYRQKNPKMTVWMFEMCGR